MKQLSKKLWMYIVFGVIVQQKICSYKTSQISNCTAALYYRNDFAIETLITEH
jgi:hypothetical protein